MQLPKFRSTLSKSEIEHIHEKTLYLLANKGMVYESEEALNIFRNAGFKVEGKTVFFTERQISEALKTTPKSFKFYGRNNAIEVKAGANVTLPFTGPVFVLSDGKYRAPVLDDYINFTKLCQSSDIMDVVGLTLFSGDIISNNPMESAKGRLALTLANSDKPIQSFAEGHEIAKMSLETIRSVNGITDQDKVVAFAHCSTDAPFKVSQSTCDTQIAYVREGQVVRGNTGGMPGVSGPLSFAGMLLQSNTERLASLVFTQTIKSGNPHLMGTSPLLSDMRFASGVAGAPECALFAMAQKDIVDYYDVPCMGHFMLTDAKIADYQAGAESLMLGFTMAYHEYAMCSMSLGCLDSYLSVGYEKFVLDEELHRVIKRLRKPIEISDDTLKLDQMISIEHGGDYITGIMDEEISDDFSQFRDDFYTAKLFLKEPHGTWESSGEKTVNELAGLEVEKRLNEFIPPELNSEQRKVLNELLPTSHRI